MDKDPKPQEEPNLNIRLLGEEDSNELLHLYMANTARLKELGLHDAKTPIEEQISYALTPKEGSDLFGIFSQQVLVGVVLVTSSTSEPKTAQIGRLIDSQHQNKGIGSNALTMVMNQVSGRYDHLWAMTREDNVLARKSLERAGFTAMSEPTDDSSQVMYIWHR